MANTTNLNLVKPAGTDHALVSDINGNMDLIDAFAGSTNTAITDLEESYDLGSNTVANIETAIYNLVGDMSNGEQKNIKFTPSAASDPFKAAAYIGQVLRITRTRFRVEVSEAVYSDTKILGRYKDGTWSWKEIALKSDIKRVEVLTFDSTNVTQTATKTELIGYALCGYAISQTKFSYIESSYITSLTLNSETGEVSVTRSGAGLFASSKLWVYAIKTP